MKKPALLIQQLSVNYEKTPALWDISLEIPCGKLTAIIGPNGAGKSTLLKAALGLIKPLSGKVSFFGHPLKEVRNKVAYVPQRESVDWDFPITVFDLVLMGRFGQKRVFSKANKKDKEDAKKVLLEVGLEAYSHRQISQLSGGQQQRAFFARALIQEADIFLMDEPFAGIDAASAKTIVSILQKLRDQGKTLLIVHHDLSAIPQIFDWAVLVNLRLVGCGPVEQVFTPEMLQKTYGVQNVLFGEAAKLSQEKTLGFATE